MDGDRIGWTEAEVRATVAAYFDLLAADQAGAPTNKVAIYRELTALFPSRSPKAFELKFQNISAVLYEQRLPYCAGLKPRGNYQRLLKLLVLDHLERSPLPAIEPHEILFSRLRDLKQQGPISVRQKGTGRFGLAVEAALGVPQNSSKSPDFMGIELKTKKDATAQTLFSRVPSRYVEDENKAAMFERHSYWDAKRERRALYTSFGGAGDSLGFSLSLGNQVVTVMRNGSVLLEYDAELLESALLSKHSQTAYVGLSTKRTDAGESCEIESVTYCKWPSIIRFLRAVDTGDIFLDFTMAQRPNGTIADHGFLWKVAGDAVEQLYLHSESVDLGPG